MGSVNDELVLLDFGRRIGVMDMRTGKIVRRFDTRPENEMTKGKPKPKPRPKPRPGY